MVDDRVERRDECAEVRAIATGCLIERGISAAAGVDAEGVERGHGRRMLRQERLPGLQQPGQSLDYRLRKADGSYLWVHAESLAQVNDSLAGWLSDSTHAGSGDDVTLGIICRGGTPWPPVSE